MPDGAQLTVRADDTDAQKALTRARRAMDAALLRNALAERTSLAALVRAGRGVARDPACEAATPTVRWNRHALKGIGRKRGPVRLDETEYAWQPEGEASMANAALCPCNERTLEDAAGNVVYHYADDGKVCGNPGKTWTSGDGQQHEDGWCDDCIDKICEWCRHD